MPSPSEAERQRDPERAKKDPLALYHQKTTQLNDLRLRMANLVLANPHARSGDLEENFSFIEKIQHAVYSTIRAAGSIDQFRLAIEDPGLKYVSVVECLKEPQKMTILAGTTFEPSAEGITYTATDRLLTPTMFEDLWFEEVTVYTDVSTQGNGNFHGTVHERQRALVGKAYLPPRPYHHLSQREV